jgi:CheY-like chemotaxis protein
MPNETILVVDDHALNLKLVRVLLASKGYKILTASDGLEGLQVAEASRPQLILLDIQLPGIDGFEVVRRLKGNAATRDIVVVALTAYAMKGDEEKVRAAGCDGYITKPIDTQQLPGQVRRYLDQTASSSPKTILVVDDDAQQLQLLCAAFERQGYVVIPAEDGPTALSKAVDRNVDIIVSDVLMPRVDGFRLCYAVRQDERLSRVPIVLVTSGSVQPADEDLARNMGASAIVLKTPDLLSLFPVVARALAEGPVTVSGIDAAELAAIRSEFLTEGAFQSRKLAGQVKQGLNVVAARRLAHRWAGTGGTLGFPQISLLASEIERLLERSGAAAPGLEQSLEQLAQLFAAKD